MGHMVRIANSLVRSGEGEEKLHELLKASLDEKTQEMWSRFLSGQLAEMNKKNETNLVSDRITSDLLDIRKIIIRLTSKTIRICLVQASDRLEDAHSSRIISS